MRLPHSIRAAVWVFSLGAAIACPAQPATNLWQFILPDYSAGSSPAVAPDGTVYQATFIGDLVAVTPDGRPKWTFKAGREIKSSPAIADDGTIYFGSRDWKLYAVSARGGLQWTFPTGAWVDSSPAIGADGTIYFGSHDKHFYALNPDGSKKWAFAAGGQIGSSPAIGADGTIYFSSADGNLYALRPDGTERWRLRTGGATESSPVLDGQGVIYLDVNNLATAVSEDGKKLWEYPAVLPVDASPAVAADRTVYFSAPWRDLIARGPDGNLRWRLTLDTAVNASPALGADGTIYVTEGKYVDALAATNGSPPLAKSSWPMFRANPRHTGRVSDSSKP
jgi:outer membrane protein assembly factor BamB